MTNDEIRGKSALVHFHNEACYYPENYTMKFEELVAKLQDMSHGQFLDGFGFAIRASEMNESKIKAAMKSLAKAGEGRLPSRWNSFFDALSSEATKISFTDAIAYTVSESAKDIADGAANVGQTIITTGSWISTLFPLVAVSALLFIAFHKTKRYAGV